ncbi:MAG: phosphatidylglycerophosphatase A [Proteobacteria bacterium]|jgi:phosphatidylglycerophosphatase A|nr:phosphatidylglycerophosphatase A [Pseudomonadota bacterium]
MPAPSFRFLIGHPAHFVALGFGAGLAPRMPGTVGTLVAFPIAWWLRSHAGDAGWLAAIVGLIVIGTWAAEVTGRDLGVADHPAIVIDEIAAFVLVLYFTGPGALRDVLAFALFRFFDILKPPPVREVDAALKNGAGVMADDLLAALYALVVFAIGQRLLGAG